MKLEIGKRYVTRSGRTTEPLLSNGGNAKWLFVGKIDGQWVTWTEFGRVLNDQCEDCDDLISEYVEESEKPAIDPQLEQAFLAGLLQDGIIKFEDNFAFCKSGKISR